MCTNTLQQCTYTQTATTHTHIHKEHKCKFNLWLVASYEPLWKTHQQIYPASLPPHPTVMHDVSFPIPVLRWHSVMFIWTLHNSSQRAKIIPSALVLPVTVGNAGTTLETEQGQWEQREQNQLSLSQNTDALYLNYIIIPILLNSLPFVCDVWSFTFP